MVQDLDNILYQEAFLHFSRYGKSADSEQALTEEKSLRLSLETTSDASFICRSQREHSLLQEMVTKAKGSPRLSLYGSVCASASGNWVRGYAVAGSETIKLLQPFNTDVVIP